MWNWIAKADELARAGQRFAVVTVVRVAGSTPCAAGAKMLVKDDGAFHGTVGGGTLERLALDDARAVLSEGVPRAGRYALGATAGQCCGGVVEVFIEPVGARAEVYVFGAGHVAQALCRTLEGTPLEVHVIDDRAEWLERLPLHVARHDEPWDAFVAAARWDAARTLAVVLTYRHDLDQEIVAALVRKPARHIALVGSRTKWEKFQQRLTARGFTAEELARVKCPAGLPIGGKSPQEVAISIAGELLQVMNGMGA